MSSDDAPPLESSNRRVKKKKRALGKGGIPADLPDSLVGLYEEGLKKLRETRPIRARDPRYDPRVPGECRPENWGFVAEERQKVIKKLTKKLKLGTASSEEEVERTKKALKLLQQKEATAQDYRIKSKVTAQISEEQNRALKEGHLPTYLKKSEVKKRIVVERLKTKTKKQKETYLAKKMKKGSSAGVTQFQNKSRTT